MADNEVPDHFAAIRPFVDRHGRTLDAILFVLVAVVTVVAVVANWPDMVQFLGAVTLVIIVSDMTGWILRIGAWALAGFVCVGIEGERGAWGVAFFLVGMALAAAIDARYTRRNARTFPA